MADTTFLGAYIQPVQVYVYLHEASIMIWNNSITGMFLARENDQKYKPPSQPQTRGPACNVSPRQDEAV